MSRKVVTLAESIRAPKPEAPAPPQVLAAIAYRDETAKLIEEWTPRMSEDEIHAEAEAYLRSPVRKLIPLVAYLRARGW